MTRGWVRSVAHKAIKDEWVAPFHVFPSFVMFVGAVIVWWAPHLIIALPPDVPYNDTGQYFSGSYDSLSYLGWLGLSVVCPALVMLSYWLPGHVNNSRYFSILIRFGGDVGLLFALAALDFSTIKIVSDAALYRQVLFIGYICFVATMVVRDIYLIVATELLAGKLEHDKCVPPEGQD